MEQPTRVTVTRAVAAPRLNLLLEETGVTAAFTIEVRIERAEPFVVERSSDDLVRFAAEIGKAYAGSTVTFEPFPLFKTSGELDDAFLEVANESRSKTDELHSSIKTQVGDDEMLCQCCRLLGFVDG